MCDAVFRGQRRFFFNPTQSVKMFRISGIEMVGKIADTYPPELRAKFERDAKAILISDRAHSLSALQQAFGNINVLQAEAQSQLASSLNGIRIEVDRILEGDHDLRDRGGGNELTDDEVRKILDRL